MLQFLSIGKKNRERERQRELVEGAIVINIGAYISPALDIYTLFITIQSSK